MRQFFTILALSVFALNLNLGAMDDAGKSYTINQVNPQELQTELLRLFPDPRAHVALKGYFEYVVALTDSLVKNTISESEYNQKVGIETNAMAKRLLAYGVDINSLKKLSEDPRWSFLFGKVLSTFESEATNVREATKHFSCGCSGCCFCVLIPILSILILFLAVLVPVMEQSGNWFNQGVQATRCVSHSLVSNCPCFPVTRAFEMQNRSRMEQSFMLVRCILHVIKEFVLKDGCPCLDSVAAFLKGHK